MSTPWPLPWSKTCNDRTSTPWRKPKGIVASWSNTGSPRKHSAQRSENPAAISRTLYACSSSRPRSKRKPEKAALAVIARGLNVRQTEALVSRKAEPTATKSRSRPLDPETAALQHDLSERLGLKVEIFFDGQAGHIRIHYRNLAQLDGLIALLSREEKPSQ